MGGSCGKMLHISCGLHVGIVGKPGGGRHVNPGGGRMDRPEFLFDEQFDVTNVTSSSIILDGMLGTLVGVGVGKYSGSSDSIRRLQLLSLAAPDRHSFH